MTSKSALIAPVQRQYSEELTTKIESAKNLTHWLLTNQPQNTKATDRNRIAGALFNIALDHHVAMVFLFSNKMPSAAFSLTRSVWEAYLRGLWARSLASDDELARFIEGKYDPKMVSLIQAIKNHSNLDNANKIGSLHDTAWKPLNAYGHGGSLQVQRWITSGSVEAAHSDEEIADLLRFANHVANRAGVALVELAEATQMEELFLQKGEELARSNWF